MMRTTQEIRAEIELEQRALRSYREGMLEGGDGYNPHEQRIEALATECVRAEIAEEDAEWSPEITRQRREGWNAMVRAAGEGANLIALQARAGYRLETLRRQVKRHGC